MVAVGRDDHTFVLLILFCVSGGGGNLFRHRETLRRFLYFPALHPWTVQTYSGYLVTSEAILFINKVTLCINYAIVRVLCYL